MNIAFSFHDTPENMIKLIDLGYFESVLCQYNVIDRINEQAMAHAHEKGLGVIVMGPLRGDRVTGLPLELTKSLNISVKSNAELAQLYCTGCGYFIPCPADVNMDHSVLQRLKNTDLILVITPIYSLFP